MSQYHFGVGNGRVLPALAEALDTIAQKHGASFTAVVLPEGPRYWFSGPNRGYPFDDKMAREVLAECEAASLWPVES